MTVAKSRSNKGLYFWNFMVIRFDRLKSQILINLVIYLMNYLLIN